MSADKALKGMERQELRMIKNADGTTGARSATVTVKTAVKTIIEII